MEYLNIFKQFLFVLVVLRDTNTTSTTVCCSTSVTPDNNDPSSTTDLSTTSESPTTTTETPTTSDDPTTSAYQTTTTEIPTTSQDSLTTDTLSTTDLPTTTGHPTTTSTATKELSTTLTEQFSTTNPPTTTCGPTTTSTTVTEPPSTTTNDRTTTEYATTTEDLTTIEMTTTSTKGIFTSASTAVFTSDKLPTTTIVPDQDDVKNYVIIALSVTLGILIIGIIIWCVYIRVSRRGQYDVSMKSPDLVSSGTQTEDLSLKGFFGRQLPPIGTNLRLISEKTKAFDYDDQMKSRKIGFCENRVSDKISNTLDLNHLYYPDAPPVVPKHKPLINFEQKNYKDQVYSLNVDLEAHNDISNSFSLLTDHYRNQVSPPYLFKKKHDSNLPDVEVPSTSASELSYDIEKKDEDITESSRKNVYLKNRYSPDKSEPSSGFSEEQTAPLSTQLIQISNMSNYTVDKDRNQESVAANGNSFEDFDKTLQETAAHLHIPIVVDMESSVPLKTWKEERPKFENIRIENKNPKKKFDIFNNANHVDEPFDMGDCKNAPLIQVHAPSNLRRVTFGLEENRAMSDSFENAGEEITLRGRRYHAHDREKSEQSDETTLSPHNKKKKKKRKLLYARKEMAEKILYATYGVKDVNRNAEVKISKGAKKKRKQSSTYA